MNTLLRYIEANGMKNEKIESLPASELDHLLSKFFLNARKQNGEEYEPATVSSFQRSIQRYLSEKKYPFNILKGNEFQNSRKVLAAKRKSLVHEHGKGNKPQAAQAIHEDEEDTARCPVSFYKKFSSQRPVEMNAPKSPFYLAVRHNRRSNEEIWYMKAPLGKNEIGKFMSTAAKNAGLQREGKK